MSDFSFEPVAGTRPDSTIVRAVGPVTLTSLPALQACLRAVTTRWTIVDLSGVPHMDSAGLGALLNFLAAQQKSGKHVCLAAPSKRVNMLLELTKVGTVLPVFPTVEQAEAQEQ